MSTPNGLQVALALAAARRDEAARLLAQTREQWNAARLQLDQLESYAAECTDRWSARSTGCTPELLRHHYQFMERLVHAIGLQNGIARERERDASRDAALLRNAEGRLESLRQLCLMREREHARLQGRREQKQSDEQAALAQRRQAARRDSEEFFA